MKNKYLGCYGANTSCNIRSTDQIKIRFYTKCRSLITEISWRNTLKLVNEYLAHKIRVACHVNNYQTFLLEYNVIN